MEKKYLKTNRQKTVGMSTERCESLNYYKYLCQNIGSEEDVKIRRLACTILDMGTSTEYKTITSGSKGEGLSLKSSDLDIMRIIPTIKVYESETEVVFDNQIIPLIMNTEETPPCFTQLCLLNSNYIYNSMSEQLKDICQTNHLGCMLSSEQYKQFFFNNCSSNVYFEKISSPIILKKMSKIHGPCISDITDQLDLATCLQCDQWIVQAQPWIRRPRSTWPAPEIISNVISCGVLFVPIGSKGSRNENLEWRISFSVAEKFLIFSFSHTQFLCYALLKILLKEIVEKHEDLKGLLCSYFLKTLMFWISEETNPDVWRPDNIIPCFMACLQRLMYCVRYSNLSHYFIPENNFFFSRFNVLNKEKLRTVLKSLYEQGIFCFVSSETLQDYKRQSYIIPDYLTRVNFRKEKQTSVSIPLFSLLEKTHLLYNFLHRSKTCVSKGLFALYLSKACWFVPGASKYLYSPENKQQYCKYKYDLSHLLIGVNSDAVTGWLTLASFFYVHKNYFASLSVINYAMKKYTDEKIFTGPTGPTTSEFTFIQKHALNLMKKEKLYTVIKALTIELLQFDYELSLIPQELPLGLALYEIYLCHPLPYAYFLSFLCYYHLHDNTSCRQYLLQLISTMTNHSIHFTFPIITTIIMTATAHQLMGDADYAKKLFNIVDMDNILLTNIVCLLNVLASSKNVVPI